MLLQFFDHNFSFNYVQSLNKIFSNLHFAVTHEPFYNDLVVWGFQVLGPNSWNLYKINLIFFVIQERAPLPALLEAVLLPVHPAVADRTTESVSALQSIASPARARQLQMGGRGESALFC